MLTVEDANIFKTGRICISDVKHIIKLSTRVGKKTTTFRNVQHVQMKVLAIFFLY